MASEHVVASERARSQPVARASSRPTELTTSKIHGVRALALEPQRDERGELIELCRHVWVEPEIPVQWNLVVNRAGVLRGIHWHERHTDYLAPVSGSLNVALVDLRPGSPTEGVAELLDLDCEAPQLIEVPVGVGHGFYSAQPSAVLYAVTRYWAPDDEFGVRHDDPALGVPWPAAAGSAIVSERDLAMPLLEDARPRAPWRGQAASAPRTSAIA